MSDGGVATFHALPSWPASSAASSLWRGRIGRLSSRRTPAANGSAKTISTVCGIDGRHLQPLMPLAVSESARLLAVFSS